MVNGAERDRELVADLEPKAPGLGEANVMGVAWRSPANNAGLLGHVAQVLLASNPLWFADCKHALVDFRTWAFGTPGIRRALSMIRLAVAAILRFNKGDGTLLEVFH